MVNDEISEKWKCNFEYDGEWSACDHYDSKEEAIECGLDAIGKFNKNPDEETIDNEFGYTPEELITAFYVGQVKIPSVNISIDDLIDQMQESAEADGGEFSEGYLSDMTEVDKKDLEKVIVEWFIEKGYSPHWFIIENAQKVLVD